MRHIINRILPTFFRWVLFFLKICYNFCNDFVFSLSYSWKDGENVTEFEELFNKNRDFIFKYLMKLSRDASLSEELTQETFFRAYMNYPSLRNKEKASVWLCQIAKNTYFTQKKEQFCFNCFFIKLHLFQFQLEFLRSRIQ